MICKRGENECPAITKGELIMQKELAKTYDPKAIEDKLYEKWTDKKYFHATVDKTKKPFTLKVG